jgi:type VI protein secretion system component VasK
VDHAAIDKIKQSIKQVNLSAQSVCSAASSVQGKYPFDTNATDESSVADLNQLLAPGTGAYSQFALSPDASRDYQHQGKVWQGKPDFPATYSEPFLATLNTLGEMEDELYAGGNASPTLNYTLSFDTTGKIPFELDIDGHVVKYSPGHPLPTLHLVWPPVTSSPTKLTVKDGSKNKKSGGNVAQWNGIWGVLHLLQAADQQSGNTFVYRTVQFAKQLNPLVDDKGNQGTIQIHVDSTASNFFNRGYFAKMRCTSTWAMQPQGLPN